MRILIKLSFFIQLYFVVSLCFINPCFAQNIASDIKRVGIVIPVEHQALREIVQGFQNTLLKLYKKPIKFKVSNAQGDVNLQRAIITQMRDANYDLVVPVTTTVTQMTASIINMQPVIGLAADVISKQNNLMIVDDEIDKAQIINFIHQTYPEIKNIILVHSASNKIFSEVERVEHACKRYHLNLHRLMIQNLADLYSTSQAIPINTQAIFVLKDSLVASGIETLVRMTRERKIFLITSDDGTVKKGASFAVGVYEKDIGVAGAKLAVKILQGIALKRPLTIKLTKPTVFVNLQALANKTKDIQAIGLAAKQFGYSVEIIK